MRETITFYFVSTGSQVIPLIMVTLILKYFLRYVFYPIIPDNGTQLNRRLRMIGITRYKLLFQLFVLHVNKYLTRFSLMACFFQLATVVAIILAIILYYYKHIPLLAFVPHIDDRWTWEVELDLAKFWVATGFIQWLPFIFLVSYLLRRISLPFSSTLTENSVPLSDEIAHGEENSEGFALIHLTRFENSEKIFIYAYCRDDFFGKIFKVALCQGKEHGARPQCFLYSDDQYFEQIIPAPVTVKVLDEIFNSTNNEVTA